MGYVLMRIFNNPHNRSFEASRPVQDHRPTRGIEKASGALK
jgi:hypothetical protein